MKLKRRVWFVIVPVVSLCYAIIFYSLYAFEKSNYLEHQQTRLRLQLNRLSASFDRYNNFADVMLTSLLQSNTLSGAIATRDDSLRAYAVERRLSRVVEGLTTFNFATFNIVVVTPEQRPLYYYVQQGDPFAEVRGELYAAIDEAMGSRQTVHRAVQWRKGESLIVRVAIVDPDTMRAPVAGQWGKAVAIGMLFDVNSFDLLRADMEKAGLKVSRVATGDSTPSSSTVHASAPFSDQLQVRIDLDEVIVERDIRQLALLLCAAYLLLCVVSAVLLIRLISRFIIGPVLALETAIRNVDEHGGNFPKPEHVSDEVSALAETFSSLYEHRMQVYRETRERSEIDVLTGLHNRNRFSESVEAMIAGASDDRQVALLYIDLDNFKFVNDSYGHETGDRLLVAFADRLCGVLRDSGYSRPGAMDLSRLAGDEFAVVLGEVEADSTLIGVAQSILDIFQHGFSCSIGQFPISASIGIAVFPRHGGDARALTVSADAAMYQAKHGGKNQYAFFSAELADRARRAAQIEATLRMRDFSDLDMHYQLLVDTEGARVKGVEALARWYSPTLGTVSPAEFIPVAESRGLSIHLDLWVVRRVIVDMPVLRSMIGADASISINISSAQLESDDFFFQLMQIVADYQVDCSQIVLEITETFAASMSQQIVANLNLLRKAGFRLALDDFGAGYTSLLQLMSYPIDIIKIDKVMVDRLDDDGRELVPALIAFCRQQGLQVTAEGVETARQAAVLIEAGVDTLQGYFFSRPLPLHELPAAVETLVQLHQRRLRSEGGH